MSHGENMSEMTKAQFELIAKLLRHTSEATSKGAFLVLVKGKANPEAYTAAGVSPQALSNTLSRFRRTHQAILDAYCSSKPEHR